MNRSSADDPISKFRVSRGSLRRKWPDAETPLRVDLVFIAGGKAPRYVAVSVFPQVSLPGKGEYILRNDEVCDRLQQWGFAIDEEMQVPAPDKTVNTGNLISMAGGLSDLVELLANAVPRPTV